MVAGLTHMNDEHTITHMNTENWNGNCPADDRETVPFFTIDGSRYNVPNRLTNAITHTKHPTLYTRA
jgi:hypothetical protein